MYFNLEQFVDELDAATQAHLEWSRRVLRCAMLRTSPGGDVLDEDAHTRCRFGVWLNGHRDQFDEIDPDQVRCLCDDHRRMHGAIRRLCSCVLADATCDPADLDEFEATQRALIDGLAHFKTAAVARASQVDALTGVPLRHRMVEDFDLLTKHVRRRGSRQFVIMADIDHFKSINDRYGHDGGDVVLRAFADTLRRVLRADDLIYRYGGEEFLMLLELPGLADTETSAAERLLGAIRALRVAVADGFEVSITATLGGAVATHDEPLTTVIHRVDAALYEGKRAGRDRFVMAEARVAG